MVLNVISTTSASFIQVIKQPHWFIVYRKGLSNPVAMHGGITWLIFFQSPYIEHAPIIFYGGTFDDAFRNNLVSSFTAQA
jgi:hypothetical protein